MGVYVGSGQDGGIDRNAFATSYNQRKDNNKFKNKQPELPENQTAKKS